MRTVSVVMLSVVLAAAVPSFAQRYDDTVTVNVVEVPVFVERFGRPVTGLTRDDFELFVNGRPQPIEYFDVLEEQVANRIAAQATPAPEDSAAASALKRRRLVVLLFDVASSSPYALQRARSKAMASIQKSDAGDTFAVATVGRGGARFIVPFTEDRIAVQRAIATLLPSGADDPFRVATLEEERSFWGEALGGAEAGSGRFADLWTPRGGGFGTSRSAATVALSYQAAIDWERTEVATNDRTFIDDLSVLADRLAPIAGVKHVVLLTERQGVGDDPADSLFQAALRMHKRFRSAGVILDGVDIRPPFAPGANADGTARSAGGMAMLPSTFLYTLALDTGGAVTSSLDNLRQRNSITYLLGFELHGEPPAGNSIRVRVKNLPPLTDVRYRKSFSLGAQDTADDSLFLADTILNDIPQRGLSVDLRVEGRWVAAAIPGPELLAQSSDRPLMLDVFFYVFDETGKAVGWNQLRISLDVVAGHDFLAANPYTIRQEFNLDPGHYAAKALIRIAGTETTGFQRTDFVVPSS